MLAKTTMASFVVQVLIFAALLEGTFLEVRQRCVMTVLKGQFFKITDRMTFSLKIYLVSLPDAIRLFSLLVSAFLIKRLKRALVKKQFEIKKFFTVQSHDFSAKTNRHNTQFCFIS